MFIQKIACVTKIYYFYVELGIKQNIFRFDVAVGNSVTVDVPEGRNELAEDVSRAFLTELFSLIYQPKQLSILLYFHDIVQYSLNFSISSAINTPEVEVYYLNDVAMSGLHRHFYFVQEGLEHSLLVAVLAVSFLHLFVQNFYGYALIRRQVYRHLDSDLVQIYLENRPKPSLKRTLYFSSMTGQRSRYSLGRSRMQFIVYNKYWYKICYNPIGHR